MADKADEKDTKTPEGVHDAVAKPVKDHPVPAPRPYAEAITPEHREVLGPDAPR